MNNSFGKSPKINFNNCSFSPVVFSFNKSSEKSKSRSRGSKKHNNVLTNDFIKDSLVKNKIVKINEIENFDEILKWADIPTLGMKEDGIFSLPNDNCLSDFTKKNNFNNESQKKYNDLNNFENFQSGILPMKFDIPSRLRSNKLDINLNSCDNNVYNPNKLNHFYLLDATNKKFDNMNNEIIKNLNEKEQQMNEIKNYSLNFPQNFQMITSSILGKNKDRMRIDSLNSFNFNQGGKERRKNDLNLNIITNNFKSKAHKESVPTQIISTKKLARKNKLLNNKQNKNNLLDRRLGKYNLNANNNEDMEDDTSNMVRKKRNRNKSRKILSSPSPESVIQKKKIKPNKKSKKQERENSGNSGLKRKHINNIHHLPSKSRRDKHLELKKHNRLAREEYENVDNKKSNEILKYTPIETNKITKRFVEDKLVNHKDRIFHNNKSKMKRRKKNKNIVFKLEDFEDKKNNVNSEYLLDPEPFDISTENMRNNLYNNDLKRDFEEYFILGRPNEKKLSFGDNPLAIYQNLAEWLNSEMNKTRIPAFTKSDMPKIKESCRMIINEMNEINKSVSNLPIMMLPDPKNKNTKVKKKRKIFKKENDNEKNFICEFCNETFDSGQGLGGHMSRRHPNKSEKFIKKKEIREKRSNQRDKLYEAKKQLLSNYGMEYDDLKKKCEGRVQIKQMVHKYKEEYKKILKDIKKTF